MTKLNQHLEKRLEYISHAFCRKTNTTVPIKTCIDCETEDCHMKKPEHDHNYAKKIIGYCPHCGKTSPDPIKHGRTCKEKHVQTAVDYNYIADRDARGHKERRD